MMAAWRRTSAAKEKYQKYRRLRALAVFHRAASRRAGFADDIADAARRSNGGWRDLVAYRAAPRERAVLTIYRVLRLRAHFFARRTLHLRRVVLSFGVLRISRTIRTRAPALAAPLSRRRSFGARLAAAFSRWRSPASTRRVVVLRACLTPLRTAPRRSTLRITLSRVVALAALMRAWDVETVLCVSAARTLLHIVRHRVTETRTSAIARRRSRQHQRASAASANILALNRAMDQHLSALGGFARIGVCASNGDIRVRRRHGQSGWWASNINIAGDISATLVSRANRIAHSYLFARQHRGRASGVFRAFLRASAAPPRLAHAHLLSTSCAHLFLRRYLMKTRQARQAGKQAAGV